VSEAFDRAMDEVDRVWEASDKFDTKVMQFVGFVIAGALAGAGAMLTKLHDLTPLPWPLITAVVLGTVLVVAFVFVALSSAVGNSFTAPLNPAILPQYPTWLNQDDEFRTDVLKAIGQAHTASVDSQMRKVRRFKTSIWLLGFGVVLLAGACMIAALIPTRNPNTKGGNMGTEDATSGNQGSGQTQNPAPAESTPVKPALLPYELQKELPGDSTHTRSGVGAKK